MRIYQRWFARGTTNFGCAGSRPRGPPPGPRLRTSDGVAQACTGDRALESEEHRLRLQLDAKRREHSRLNFILQRDDVGRRGAPAIHDRERVPAGNSGYAPAVTLSES